MPRPKIPPHLVRKHLTMRLPTWMVEKLEALTMKKADAVAEALKRTFHWKEPKK